MCGLRFLGGFLKQGRGRDSTIFFFFFWAKAFKEINRKLSSRANGYSHVCVCCGIVHWDRAGSCHWPMGLNWVPFTYRPPHDK